MMSFNKTEQPIIEVIAEELGVSIMDYHVNRKVWQILWDAIMTPFGFCHSGRGEFQNETFEYYPYVWDDNIGLINTYHFRHIPSGFTIEWYKYPLRGAMCNMNITDDQFVDVLYDCTNSLQINSPIKITHHVDKWWSVNEGDKDE